MELVESLDLKAHIIVWTEIYFCLDDKLVVRGRRGYCKLVCCMPDREESNPYLSDQRPASRGLVAFYSLDARANMLREEHKFRQTHSSSVVFDDDAFHTS